MSDRRRPAAIIFDLDGTLVDTVPARIAGWSQAFDEVGIPASRERIEPLIGMDGRRLATDLAREFGIELSAERAEEIDRRAGELFDEHNRTPAVLPGVHACLERLDAAGITWAIATSSRREQIGASIAALDLGRPPRVVDGSSVEHAKPAPDLLHQSARELSVDPGECWYVGDSTWDMRAAVAARMRAVGILAGSAVDAAALSHAGAEVVLETLDALDVAP
jgi:HAD superfamily hydrolase (TIGR01509 family)